MDYKNVREQIFDLLKYNFNNNDIYTDLASNIAMKYSKSKNSLTREEENLIIEIICDLFREGYINFGNSRYGDHGYLHIYSPTQKLLKLLNDEKLNIKKIEERNDKIKKSKESFSNLLKFVYYEIIDFSANVLAKMLRQ